VKSPRIVTHLFADGGRIIKTARTSYADLVGRADLSQVVRQLMKDQHKSMFTALRTGVLDELLEASCGPLPLPAAASAAARVESAAAAQVASAAAPLPNASSSGLVPRAVVAVEAAATAPAPPLAAPHVSSPVAQPAARSKTLTNPNMYKVAPSVVPPASREAIDLAVGSLENLGAQTSTSASLRSPIKSEPPKARKSSPAAARKSRTPAAPAAASARPSSRYGSVPSKSARSIFGDGVISEKSLDEVILSYLAEDLDGPTE
jgi:hypothetical protein